MSISLNSAVIAGWTTSLAGAGALTAPAALERLDDDGAEAMFAYGIDASGSISGTLRAGVIAAAFRWTDDGGLDVLDRFEFTVPAAGRGIGGGVVVGAGAVSEGDLIPLALRWPAGSSAVDVLGAPQGLQGATASDIAADGETIVGTTVGPGGFTREQAFVLSDDVFAPLADSPSGADSIAGGIAGGWVNPGQSLVSGVVWALDDNGQTLLSGSAWSQVTSVSQVGGAAGVAQGVVGPAAFYIESGSSALTFIHDASTADRSVAFGTNTHGDVVGIYESDGERRAFAWNTSSGLVDLNTLLDPSDAAAWRLTQARAINDSRQIAGFGWYDDGAGAKFRAFRLTLPPSADCSADRNANGIADSGDVSDFLAAAAAGNITTDLDSDGSVTFFDVLLFLEHYDACG